MEHTKSFKEIMDVLKQKHPEIIDTFIDLEKHIGEKQKNGICIMCNGKFNEDDK